MKFLQLFHNLLIIVFAVINGSMLYLFLMKLPYGFDPLIASFRHWDQLSPNIGIMLTLSVALTFIAIALVKRTTADWKNRLLYLRSTYAHPAFNAFLNNRKQPFESATLLKAHPSIKDSGFNPQTQIDLWKKLHTQHQMVPVVMHTRLHWKMLRDLYLVSILFLSAFILAWLGNLEAPFQFVALYLFVFGAQALFLMLTAKRIGWKLIDNVLAVDLGMKEGESLKS